jgi:hypothetical protein
LQKIPIVGSPPALSAIFAAQANPVRREKLGIQFGRLNELFADIADGQFTGAKRGSPALRK